MNKVCKDVQKEPSLLPMAGKGINKSDNKSSKAWLDISAKDLWIPYQRVFFAIRAFDTNVQRYRTQNVEKMFQTNEKEENVQ